MSSSDVVPLPVFPIPLALPRRLTVSRLATTCRAVGLRFLNTTKGGWEKHELAAFLTGSYRSIIRFADEPSPISERRLVPIDPYAPSPIGVRSGNASSSDGPPSSRHAPISRERIHAVVFDARVKVLRALEDLSHADRGTDVAFDALHKGLVIRCLDQFGETGWLPADLPRLGLADRVISLFVADYLVRSDDYEREFYQCSVCGDADFDDEAREMGECFGHLVGCESGVVTKGRLSGLKTAAND